MKDGRSNTVLIYTRTYWFMGYCKRIEWSNWKLADGRYKVPKEYIVVYNKSL